jgi:2,4-dienoyl-CoA reductase-like NADH-dependent reductase (Old Yellow Enzyme family)
MHNLFSPIKIRGIEFKNRIVVSPMCQYSGVEGMPKDWHLVHLGSRAVGGAALIIQEATAVSPEGRISPDDLGIWSGEHGKAYKKITEFIKSQNCIPGIQLAHAGRKASTYAPWKGEGRVNVEDGGWVCYAPSPIAFSENYPAPKKMSKKDIEKVINDFKDAAKRSVDAGYQVIELHFAHGYLVHQFLSPISNKRADEYGGSFENRYRLAMEIVKEVRRILPDDCVLFTRISCTDWVDGGWGIGESVKLAKMFKDSGVDLIDCSSGGNIANAKIPIGSGYQIPFSEKIKKETGILTGGVGLITEPKQADEIIREGRADLVLLAREMLRSPYWPINAARELKIKVEIPNQHKRAY